MVNKMKDIIPTEVFNQWIVFDKTKYNLVNTIDLDIGDTIKNIMPNYRILNILMINNLIGERVLKKIKELKLELEYDAFTIIHVMEYEGKLTVGIDCFKKATQ